MAEIQLTRGKIALVDDDDFEWLDQWKWTTCQRKNGKFHGYRQHQVAPGVMRPITLARQILGLSYGDQRWADHMNFDTLDDRRGNLRILTANENREHQPPRTGTSKFVGVTWNRQRQLWCAQIQHAGRVLNLGRYETELEAAVARDEYVKRNRTHHSLNL